MLPECAGGEVERRGGCEWQALVSRLLGEARQGSCSPFSPYLNSLPSMSEHPMLAHNHPPGTWLADLLEGREEGVRECAELLQESVPDVRWASAIVSSRAFRLSRRGLALVPWADCLNHSAHAGQDAELDEDDGTAFLLAFRDFQPFEEVADSYGTASRSKAEVYADHGFLDSAARDASSIPIIRDCSNSSRRLHVEISSNGDPLKQVALALDGGRGLVSTEKSAVVLERGCKERLAAMPAPCEGEIARSELFALTQCLDIACRHLPAR